MRGDRRKEIIYYLPEEKINELLREFEDDRQKERVGFLKILYCANTIAEATDRESRSAATGGRWAKAWNKGGLEGLMVDDDVYTDGGTVLGFFDASQPQPYNNSRRVWYVDHPHVERPLVKTEDLVVGFYALNGQSVVRWKETEEKERICEVLAAICEQNPGKRILLVLDKHSSHICEYTRKRAHQLGIDVIFHSLVFS